jgi:hypothetical protein
MSNASEQAFNRHKRGFRGPTPDVGKATQFKLGKSGNPGGRPKARISEAAREWLSQVDSKSGKTNAELVVLAIGKLALKGDITAYKAIADRTEGKPPQSQQYEVISNSPVRLELKTPDLITALRQIYGLQIHQGGRGNDADPLPQLRKAIV